MGALIQKSGEGARIGIEELFQPWKKKEFNTECTEKTWEAMALSKRMVRRIVESVKPRDGQLGAGHVEAVLQLARSGQSGSSLHLPGGVEVRRERDALVFHAVENEGVRNAHSAPHAYDYNIDLAHGAQGVDIAELGCVFRLRVIDWPPKRGETSMDKSVLDRDRLRFPMVLRNWRPGYRL